MNTILISQFTIMWKFHSDGWDTITLLPGQEIIIDETFIKRNTAFITFYLQTTKFEATVPLDDLNNHI